MPSLPPTLPTLCPCSHASHLPRLAGCCATSCPPPTWLLVTPLPPIWRRLHPSTSHCAAASSCHAPLLLQCGGLLSTLTVCRVASRCAAASRQPAPPPLIRTAASHCVPLAPFVWLVVSVAPHRANAFHLTAAPPTLVLVPLPLVAPHSCLSSTLAGCCHVASPHDGALSLPAPTYHMPHCLIFPPLTSFHGSHGTAHKSIEYHHHIHGFDV
jgi:hypothetical protein